MRVYDIRIESEYPTIECWVEEIPTEGFEETRFHSIPGLAPRGRTLLQWDIGATFATRYSREYLASSAQGANWCLYFSPAVVRGVVNLASQWQNAHDDFDRYYSVLDWLSGHYWKRAHDPIQHAFPDHPDTVRMLDRRG